MERPYERRTSARTAVVWEAVQSLLEGSGGEDGTEGEGSRREQRVLDIGGGTGGFAVRVAGRGHRVTVVDPSPDALAALARRAAEQDVADRVVGVQGDLAGLGDLAPEGGLDLVLCHGVLGLVDDPVAALRTIASVLRPGGSLSLVVGQRHAAVLARAMAGHFSQASALLLGEAGKEGSRVAERRFSAEEATGLLEESGFDVASIHGVRVFTDLVPSSLLDLEPGAAGALLELERAVSTRPEYLTVASQLHVVATR
ncbi:MAG: methyltransferase protein [Marmoricola sp.]|nr:methyltransferase protein [Marmoricola sp.]